MIPLTEQLECAQEVLKRMRLKQSKWISAQEGIIATIERALAFQELSDEIKGRPTQQVGLV